jgi:hypothetical protein
MGIGLSGAAGEAIARRAGKWRLIAIGSDGRGEDTACSGGERNNFRRYGVGGRSACFGQGEDEEVNLLGGLGVAE